MDLAKLLDRTTKICCMAVTKRGWLPQQIGYLNEVAILRLGPYIDTFVYMGGPVGTCGGPWGCEVHRSLLKCM